MNENLETILDQCLERMANGESLESCLRSYPQHAAVLRDLLVLGSRLQALAVPPARKEARQVGEARLRDQLQTARRTPVSNLLEVITMKKIFVSVLMFCALLVGSGALTAFASQDALPGDALYAVKTGLEGVQMSLTMDHASAARLALQLVDRRLMELNALAQANRYADMQPAIVLLDAHLSVVQQAIDTLRRTNPVQAQAIAILFSQAQQSQAGTLAALMDNAPLEAQAALQQVSVSFENTRHRADDVRTQMPPADVDATPVVSPTLGVTVTSTVTVTPTASETLFPTFEPTETLAPTEIPVTVTLTITPTITVIPTTTVAPTQPPRPTQTPKPTANPEPTESPEPGDGGDGGDGGENGALLGYPPLVWAIWMETITL
ncbi:MAG: hypothetical protein Fur0018_11930 [Anaerolineales bacterium]